MNEKDIEEIVEQILIDITNCDGEQEVREMLHENLATLTQHHEAEVERAVEAERERIKKIVFKLGTETLANKAGIYKPIYANEIIKALTPTNSSDKK